MKFSMGLPRIAAVVVGALALSGCGILGGKVDMGMSEAMKQHCPPVGIVAYTGQLTRFAGDGRQTGDVALRAEVTNLKIICSSPKDQTQVNARITFDIVGERGPASTDSGATLKYFVALADENQKVLKKDVYDTSLTFGSSDVVISHEKLNAVLPQKGDDVPYEEVLIGLQLERGEFGYNVARGAGK
ncbi:hypothetical protein [Emcibacter sp. SYSU 3D8]|uniref:hypothetical protein n=1 Tax=Emcibacter sp. SYSU 3D8 TaxID=3133969 RepID=UPI0031FF0962